MTIPVARLVGTRLHDAPMPQRFCYAGSVFRYGELHGGQQREFGQAGVELIGAPGPQADAEVLALTAHALDAAGLAGARLALGQMAFFDALLDELRLDPAQQAALHAAIDRNSDAALAEFLQDCPLPGAQRRTLEQLPHLTGEDAAAVLERAHGLALNAGMHAALDRLRAILEHLDASGLAGRVTLDLTEIHNLGYYTGITFEALAPGLGFPVAGGGRYDHMVGTFGPDQPAVGAGLLLDRILLARRSAQIAEGSAAHGAANGPRPVPPHLLVDAGGDPAALAAVAAWRALGLRVVVDVTGAGAEALWPAAQRMGTRRALAWRRDSAVPGFTLYGEGSAAYFLPASEGEAWARRTFAAALAGAEDEP
jgi:ATP phosphoribosyltransferase regulatory subunit